MVEETDVRGKLAYLQTLTTEQHDDMRVQAQVKPTSIVVKYYLAALQDGLLTLPYTSLPSTYTHKYTLYYAKKVLMWGGREWSSFVQQGHITTISGQDRLLIMSHLVKYVTYIGYQHVAEYLDEYLEVLDELQTKKASELSLGILQGVNFILHVKQQVKGKRDSYWDAYLVKFNHTQLKRSESTYKQPQSKKELIVNYLRAEGTERLNYMPIIVETLTKDEFKAYIKDTKTIQYYHRLLRTNREYDTGFYAQKYIGSESVRYQIYDGWVSNIINLSILTELGDDLQKYYIRTKLSSSEMTKIFSEEDYFRRIVNRLEVELGLH